MNDMSEIDTLSEPTLRRALRLDADEQAPRLDASAIVAAAGRRSRREQLVRLTRGLALVGVALTVDQLHLALPAVLDVDPSGLLGFGLAAFAGAAERLVPLASAATDPAVATATLAGLIFATIYERGVGREPARVRAS